MHPSERAIHIRQSKQSYMSVRESLGDRLLDGRVKQPWIAYLCLRIRSHPLVDKKLLRNVTKATCKKMKIMVRIIKHYIVMECVTWEASISRQMAPTLKTSAL